MAKPVAILFIYKEWSFRGKIIMKQQFELLNRQTFDISKSLPLMPCVFHSEINEVNPIFTEIAIVLSIHQYS